MYQKYSERNSWKFFPVSSSKVCASRHPRSQYPSAFCIYIEEFSLFTFLAEKGGHETYVTEIKG